MEGQKSAAGGPESLEIAPVGSHLVMGTSLPIHVSSTAILEIYKAKNLTRIVHYPTVRAVMLEI